MATKQDTMAFVVNLMEKANKGNFWLVVDELMQWLYKNYNKDMKFAEEEAKQKREANFNRFGASKDLSFRDLGMIPLPISALVKKLYKMEDDKKIYREFFRKYPQLRSAEKI